MSTPVAFGDRRLPPRFWRKVEVKPTTGCWEWTGSRNRYGYGRYCIGSGTARAHRHLFRTLVGELDASESVRHTCDNPPCVNPEHLLRGSHDENMRDAVDRGRTAWGERSGRAILTEATLLEARAARSSGAAVKDLAATYGIHPSAMSRALRGKAWARVAAQAGVVVLVFAGFIGLDLSVPAQAYEGSHFTVSSTEIVACYTTDPGTLDANVKFEDGTRVNFHPWPYTLTSGCYTFTLPTGHGLPTWVQVHGFNCHIGEDNTGREQNCSWLPTTTPTEEPTWPSPPATTPPSATPSEEPKTDTTEPAEPSPEPSSTSPEPEETWPTPEPSATESGPTEGTTGSPSQPDPIEPTTPPAPIQSTKEDPSWSTPISPQPSSLTPALSSPTTTPSATSMPPSVDSKTPPQSSAKPSGTSTSLAVTGSNDPLVGTVAALACVLLGTYLYLTRRRP